MTKVHADCLPRLRLCQALLALTLLGCLATASAATAKRLTLSMRDTPMSEVMSMLARQNRVNILLADSVDGEVSFNLYDVSLDEAIRSIARAGGYVVERQNGTYFVMEENQAGKVAGSGFTVVKSMPVRYADPAQLESKLGDYLSDFGNITALPERKLLVVEDQPGFVYRISQLVAELDQRPPQVLIEAKILEIKLSDELSYGIDWQGLFTNGDGSGDFGLQGLQSPGNSGNAGFFFNYLEPNIEANLRLLESDGRIRNLASPKVVTVVNEEAEVIIGDRRGYRVTTTINQVTTESIEFLESGTILRVTPTIDQNNQILLSIHPEVSTGTVDENGVPSQTTTEVTTRLLVPSGQSIFIGGLMRNTTTESRSGVPILGRVPGLRWLFSNKSRTTVNTETIVIITPRLIDDQVVALNQRSQRDFDANDREMRDHAEAVNEVIEDNFEPMQPQRESVDETVELAPNGEVITRDAVPNDGARVPAAKEVSTPAATASVVLNPGSTPARATPPPSSVAETQAPTPSGPEPSAPAPPAPEQAAETALQTASGTPVLSGDRRPAPEGRFAINLHSDLMPIEFLPTTVETPENQLVYITEAELEGVTWHRLRLGFFATEADAQVEMARWLDDYPNAWLVKVGPREHASAPASALPVAGPVVRAN